MISLVDTHAHIDLPDFDVDREAMLERARVAGVHAIVAIGHNPDRWRSTAFLASQFPAVLRTAGVHPNDATIWNADIASMLEAELASGEPVAVGETGLDFFRNAKTAAIQREAFVAQIKLAQRSDLPIVIHQRNAEREVIELLREHGPVRGVMHCFSGDASFARDCLEAGMMLGVGGVATYPKSDDVRNALSQVPIESVIVETDAPYLSPQKWRGKRNEPSFMVATVETLAMLHDLSPEAVAERTTSNAVRLFGERLESTRLSSVGPEGN